MQSDKQFVEEAVKVYMRIINCENPQYVELPYVKKIIEYSIKHPKKHDAKELEKQLDKLVVIPTYLW